MYQGALVAMRRHLDCSTWSFLIWERAAALQKGTRIVHHGTDELLIKQNTIPDGETASPVQERSKRSQSLCRFLPHLVDMLRPVEPFIKGNSKISDDVDPLDWLSEELYCSGVLDTPTSLVEKHRELFETLMAILHALNHRSRSLR